MPSPQILIGWTTVDSAKAAHKMAAAIVAARLAACVQVDGPITSHYIWKGRQERTQEWRLWIKFFVKNAEAVETWLAANHPYSTPQWLVVEAHIVAESYRKWVMANARQPASGARRRDRRA